MTAQRMAALAKMVGEGKINPSAAATLSEKMLSCPDDPGTIAEREKLLQVSDTSALEAIIDEVLAANPKALDDAKEPGKKQQKAFGFLLGQVMQKSRGQANPQIVNEILRRKMS